DEIVGDDAAEAVAAFVRREGEKEGQQLGLLLGVNFTETTDEARTRGAKEQALADGNGCHGCLLCSLGGPQSAPLRADHKEGALGQRDPFVSKAVVFGSGASRRAAPASTGPPAVKARSGGWCPSWR